MKISVIFLDDLIMILPWTPSSLVLDGILRDLKREETFCFTLVPKGIKKCVIARKNCLFRLAAGACKLLAEMAETEARLRGQKVWNDDNVEA